LLPFAEIGASAMRAGGAGCVDRTIRADVVREHHQHVVIDVAIRRRRAAEWRAR
jgi:hypothetical protein